MLLARLLKFFLNQHHFTLKCPRNNFKVMEIYHHTNFTLVLLLQVVNSFSTHTNFWSQDSTLLNFSLPSCAFPLDSNQECPICSKLSLNKNSYVGKMECAGHAVDCLCKKRTCPVCHGVFHLTNSTQTIIELNDSELDHDDTDPDV